MSGDIILDFFALIGMIAFLAILAVIGCCVFEGISSKIADLKWEYKYKHRFDEPPLAKCYCKDCIYYSQRNGYGRCKRGHIDKFWNIADSWFCWQASPHMVDPDKEKKVQDGEID